MSEHRGILIDMEALKLNLKTIMGIDSVDIEKRGDKLYIVVPLDVYMEYRVIGDKVELLGTKQPPPPKIPG